MSDYNCIDVIRGAQATVVAAAQSSTSFVPPLGREKARVFTLNLRNRMIFKAADEEGAVESADFLGKKGVVKKSWGYTGGSRSRNYSEQEEHKIKPYVLRNLGKHSAVLVYCGRGIVANYFHRSTQTGRFLLGFVECQAAENSTCYVSAIHLTRKSTIN
jgi:hypothetical protein